MGRTSVPRWNVAVTVPIDEEKKEQEHACQTTALTEMTQLPGVGLCVTVLCNRENKCDKGGYLGVIEDGTWRLSI